MLLTTMGIVLREVQYKEADKILTVLTKDLGKCTVKARGCRRKNSKLAAGSQILVYSEMTLFRKGEFLTLNEVDPQAQFLSVREDIELLSLGSYFAEVTDATVQEGMDTEEILPLLLNCLYALDTLKKPQWMVKAVFELRSLCLSGYEPDLMQCAVCASEQPEHAVMHLSQGILCCRECRKQIGHGVCMPLSPAALAAARHIVYGNPKKLFSFTLSGPGARELGNMTEAFLMTQHERGFRTLDYYKQIAR